MEKIHSDLSGNSDPKGKSTSSACPIPVLKGLESATERCVITDLNLHLVQEDNMEGRDNRGGASTEHIGMADIQRERRLIEEQKKALTEQIRQLEERDRELVQRQTTSTFGVETSKRECENGE